MEYICIRPTLVNATENFIRRRSNRVMMVIHLPCLVLMNSSADIFPSFLASTVSIYLIYFFRLCLPLFHLYVPTKPRLHIKLIYWYFDMCRALNEYYYAPYTYVCTYVALFFSSPHQDRSNLNMNAKKRISLKGCILTQWRAFL